MFNSTGATNENEKTGSRPGGAGVCVALPLEAALRLKHLAEQGNETLRHLGLLAVQIQGDHAILLSGDEISVDLTPLNAENCCKCGQDILRWNAPGENVTVMCHCGSAASDDGVEKTCSFPQTICKAKPPTYSSTSFLEKNKFLHTQSGYVPSLRTENYYPLSGCPTALPSTLPRIDPLQDDHLNRLATNLNRRYFYPALYMPKALTSLDTRCVQSLDGGTNTKQDFSGGKSNCFSSSQVLDSLLQTACGREKPRIVKAANSQSPLLLLAGQACTTTNKEGSLSWNCQPQESTSLLCQRSSSQVDDCRTQDTFRKNAVSLFEHLYKEQIHSTSSISMPVSQPSHLHSVADINLFGQNLNLCQDFLIPSSTQVSMVSPDHASKFSSTWTTVNGIPNCFTKKHPASFAEHFQADHVKDEILRQTSLSDGNYFSILNGKLAEVVISDSKPSLLSSNNALTDILHDYKDLAFPLDSSDMSMAAKTPLNESYNYSSKLSPNAVANGANQNIVGNLLVPWKICTDEEKQVNKDFTLAVDKHSNSVGVEKRKSVRLLSHVNDNMSCINPALLLTCRQQAAIISESAHKVAETDADVLEKPSCNEVLVDRYSKNLLTNMMNSTAFTSQSMAANRDSLVDDQTIKPSQHNILLAASFAHSPVLFSLHPPFAVNLQNLQDRNIIANALYRKPKRPTTKRGTKKKIPLKRGADEQPMQRVKANLTVAQLLEQARNARQNQMMETHSIGMSDWNDSNHLLTSSAEVISMPSNDPVKKVGETSPVHMLSKLYLSHDISQVDCGKVGHLHSSSSSLVSTTQRTVTSISVLNNMQTEERDEHNVLPLTTSSAEFLQSNQKTNKSGHSLKVDQCMGIDHSNESQEGGEIGLCKITTSGTMVDQSTELQCSSWMTKRFNNETLIFTIPPRDSVDVRTLDMSKSVVASQTLNNGMATSNTDRAESSNILRNESDKYINSISINNNCEVPCNVDLKIDIPLENSCQLCTNSNGCPQTGSFCIKLQTQPADDYSVPSANVDTYKAAACLNHHKITVSGDGICNHLSTTPCNNLPFDEQQVIPSALLIRAVRDQATSRRIVHSPFIRPKVAARLSTFCPRRWQANCLNLPATTRRQISAEVLVNKLLVTKRVKIKNMSDMYKRRTDIAVQRKKLEYKRRSTEQLNNSIHTLRGKLCGGID